MKKGILFLAAVTLGWFTLSDVRAQETVFSAGVEAAVPMGDWSDLFDFGFGASLTVERSLSDHFAVTGSAGMTAWTNDSDIPIDHFYLFPIQLGGRYIFDSEREGLYAGLKAGVHIANSKSKVVHAEGETLGGESTTDTDFSFAPEVGWFFSKAVSLDARYQMIVKSGDKQLYPNGKTDSYIAVGATYHF